ncbi:hypothetical protein P3L10_014535 [Capsicum annuum]
MFRVTGYDSKRPLQILVETGSSRNFIDPEVVKQLECPTKATTLTLVAAANGIGMKVDSVCEISWLLQGAEFAGEFLLLPLGSRSSKNLLTI